VPNNRLAVEEPLVNGTYKGKSLAEQRSIDIAWQLLMLPRFENLRRCIYTTKAQCLRFRALIVNSVMATDIFDKDLKTIREDRWDKAFHMKEQQVMSDLTKEDVHRKATIVIEHIIQASDVAHTMQHWHIYVVRLDMLCLCRLVAITARLFVSNETRLYCVEME
jgi:3'5'-cyclic nucleotide phosphodiesterase